MMLRAIEIGVWVVAMGFAIARGFQLKQEWQEEERKRREATRGTGGE